MARSANSSAMAPLAVALLLMALIGQCQGQLRFGFYNGKCGRSNVERIIFNVVRARFQNDRTIPAALLRLQFHDCFVRGCDASILLDGRSSEKRAGPNGSVRGYDLIDAAKSAVERTCPGVVSCADIIIIATRASVFLGGGSWYEVPTGRRDGRVSRASEVNLPAPTISVSGAIQAFGAQGLTTEDFVLLLGGHTVGITHCSFITDRLYNFRNSGRADPSMSANLVGTLRRTCPRNSGGNNQVALDQNSRSVNIVDNSFYRQVLASRGILHIDQALASDSRTRPIVQSLANAPDFGTRFGRAMVKLGGVRVLTGRQGEIRRSCRFVNRR